MKLKPAWKTYTLWQVSLCELFSDLMSTELVLDIQSPSLVVGALGETEYFVSVACFQVSEAIVFLWIITLQDYEFRVTFVHVCVIALQ